MTEKRRLRIARISIYCYTNTFRTHTHTHMYITTGHTRLCRSLLISSGCRVSITCAIYRNVWDFVRKPIKRLFAAEKQQQQKIDMCEEKFIGNITTVADCVRNSRNRQTNLYTYTYMYMCVCGLAYLCRASRARV